MITLERLEEHAKIFRALSHSLRLMIVCGLLEKGRCNVNTMSERTGVSQALVSQHLKILKDCGIIKGARDGNVIWYSISDERIKKILLSLDLGCVCDH